MLSSYLLYGMVFFCLERIKLIGKMNTFSVADDKTLIELITQARRRLVYLAPGVSEPIARAIARRLPEQGLLDINLILCLTENPLNSPKPPRPAGVSGSSGLIPW